MYRTLGAALAGAAVIAGFGEWLRRGAGAPPDVTRKLYLGATALSAVPAGLLIEEESLTASLYLALAALAYVSFRFEALSFIEDDGPRLGSVYFPLSCAVLFSWLTDDRAFLAVAAILIAGLGDGAAALVGRRTGSRKYRAPGAVRSMEGTLAMFFVGGLAAAPVLALWGELGWHQAVAFALITATVAACVEAVSPYSSDNLTVPLAAGLTLVALTRFSQ